MQYLYDPNEQDRVIAARESFSGRLLTNAQFDEAMAITGIVEREIKKSGAFKEKLGDYVYAFARSEGLDPIRTDAAIRDLFRARTGQSMNQMREALAEREEKLTAKQKASAYEYATAVGTMIEQGDKISFNRAFAHQAETLALELGITDAGAKRLMKEGFQAAEGRDFYDYGKQVEEEFYRPQIEAEKQKAEERSQRDERPGRGSEPVRGSRSSFQRNADRRPFQRRPGP